MDAFREDLKDPRMVFTGFVLDPHIILLVLEEYLMPGYFILISNRSVIFYTIKEEKIKQKITKKNTATEW